MSSLFGAPLWKKGLLRAGLEATDRAGTPVSSGRTFFNSSCKRRPPRRGGGATENPGDSGIYRGALRRASHS